jgi:hypothetical protein
VITAPFQYEAYSGTSSNPHPNSGYKHGEEYFDLKYGQNTADEDLPKRYDHIRKVEELIIPIFLEQTGENAEWATYYYSPHAQKAAGRPPPGFASSPEHEDITDLLLPPGSGLLSGSSKPDFDFRFYRLRSDAGKPFKTNAQ